MTVTEIYERRMLYLAYTSTAVAGVYYLSSQGTVTLPWPWYLAWGGLTLVGGLLGLAGLLRRCGRCEAVGMGLLVLALLVRAISIAINATNNHISVAYVAIAVFMAAYAIRRSEPSFEERLQTAMRQVSP